MTTKKSKPLAGQKLVDAIVQSLEEKLAEKIIVIGPLDTTATSGWDWHIICQGDNTSHTSAIANALIDTLKAKYNTRPFCHEGTLEGHWALIDYSDIAVHVMLPEIRELYNLESLWGYKP